MTQSHYLHGTKTPTMPTFHVLSSPAPLRGWLIMYCLTSLLWSFFVLTLPLLLLIILVSYNNYCMYLLVSLLYSNSSYRWVYTLFSSKLLLSLWPLVSTLSILGVTIYSDNRNDHGHVRMLIYGPAHPCMCQYTSVHSCSAGPCPPDFFRKYIPQSEVKLILAIILQK